jgi:hypothetical protein
MNPLEAFEVVYFGELGLIGLLASESFTAWLEKWSGEISSLALAAFASARSSCGTHLHSHTPRR